MKKIIHWIAKHHIIEIFITFILVVFIITKNGLEVTKSHYKITNSDTWYSFIDNLISGVYFAVVCFLFFKFDQWLERKCEDAVKLSDDYSKLTEQYYSDRLICYNKENKKCYPVTFVGICEIQVYPKKYSHGTIKIDDNKNEHYALPDIIQNNFLKIMKAHGLSEIYNSEKIRAVKLEIVDGDLYMKTERTTFYDSLVTNRAMDYEWANGITNRNYFEFRNHITNLSESQMSNHIGINGFIVSSDDFICVVKRNCYLSIGKNMYSTSIGTALRIEDSLNENNVFDAEGLTNGIIKSMYRELKINESNIKDIKIISAYRDLVEGGKPQILFIEYMNKKKEDIEYTFYGCKKFKKLKIYYNSIKNKITKNADIDGCRLVWLEVEAIKDKIDFCINGIRYNNKMMKMMPSSSASFCLLKEYLIKQS